jgi:membrane protease YdiL (CAAX protease family)
MLTRLIDAGVPKPILASGIIWGAWHTPLILSGQYASGSHPYVSAALFMVNIAAFAYLAAYARLSSGSVWPAVLLHAAWNAIIQGPFDRNTVDTPMSVGESGYLTTVVTIAVVVWMTRGKPGATVRERG